LLIWQRNTKQPWTCLGKIKINLVEFSQQYPVLPEVFTIVEMVEEISGKEIDFQIHEKLPVDGLIKIARANMPKHLLKIKASKVKNISEMIAHECGHALRVYSVAPSERRVSFSNSFLVAMATGELESEKSSLPPETKSMMVDTWINGLVMQVNNLPVDVRIERWIYDTYPGLRMEQKEYLENLADTCVSSFSKETLEITPPKVFRCNMAMVYAFLSAIGLLIGEDYSQHFAPYPEIIQYGKVLVKLLEEPDRGYLQDIETTNYWAKILGLTNWFSWTDFENVPEEYGE